MLFLYLSLISIYAQWTKACPLLKNNEEVFWASQPSTIDLRGKDWPRKIDDDEPRVVRLAFKPSPSAPKPIRSDLDEKIRKGSKKVDQTVQQGVVRIEKKIEDGLKQVEDELDRKKRKRSLLAQILITMGIKDNSPKRRKRIKIRRLNEAKETAPKPPVIVRVHPPPRSAMSESNPPPPIVYAPPLRNEKYPPPGVGLRYPPPGVSAPYYAKFPPPALSMMSSQEVEMSGESDEEFPNRRFKRGKFRDDAMDDDSVRRIHILVKGDKQSEGKRTPSGDDEEDDIVRKVHLARDPIPAQRKRRRQRTGTRVTKNRMPSKPIPVVF